MLNLGGGNLESGGRKRKKPAGIRGSSVGKKYTTNLAGQKVCVLTGKVVG